MDNDGECDDGAWIAGGGAVRRAGVELLARVVSGLPLSRRFAATEAASLLVWTIGDPASVVGGRAVTGGVTDMETFVGTAAAGNPSDAGKGKYGSVWRR